MLTGERAGLQGTDAAIPYVGDAELSSTTLSPWGTSDGQTGPRNAVSSRSKNAYADL